jgi:protein-disulfide isomerase
MKRNVLFISAIVVLAAAFAGGTQFWRSSQAQQAAAAAAKNREALVRMHSVTLGRAEAPVQLVEFFDPACDTCAQFYPLVKKLVADHRDEIRLVERYAPLHPGSDEVVKALEASRRQGKFWPALEALFAAQPEWVLQHQAHVELIWPALARAGVDIEQVKKDMQSPEVASVIAQDLADARTMNVSATPEFFVNGRPLPSFGWDQLQTLVDEELKATRTASAN